jgi:hypothetical protein
VAPKAKDFERELQKQIAAAVARGLKWLDVNAGELHRDVGGNPSARGESRMPVCCGVMRRFRRPGDYILDEPPSGNGARLTIRYLLSTPRGFDDVGSR